MINVDSKQIRRDQEVGRARAPICKVLRFHFEKIRLAQQSLSADKEMTEISNLNSAIITKWQRMIIIALKKGPLCACDIAYAIGLSLPATSHQLKHLHKQKMISYNNSGKMVYYSLANKLGTS